MRIAIVDTYYPDFIKTVPLQGGTYEQELARLMESRFGTFDAYSRLLRTLGHEVVDIIANHGELLDLWESERDIVSPSHITTALAQISEFNPEVIFFQDLSLLTASGLLSLKSKYILAGQCSCAPPNDTTVSRFDVLFTSLPTHMHKFESLGVRAVYLPLAFDPIVIERTPVASSRTHAVSFVGGYGNHWQTDKLFSYLAKFTPIQFWGYGFGNAPKAVRDRWCGPAWGLDMYEIYMRSHIVLNRHGGVSQGFANNLRLFEATGCGALLLTEAAPNLTDFFSGQQCATYTSPEDAAAKIHYYLERPDELRQVASAGQARTLSAHTYHQRMPQVSKVLQECVERKSVSA